MCLVVTCAATEYVYIVSLDYYHGQRERENCENIVFAAFQKFRRAGWTRTHSDMVDEHREQVEDRLNDLRTQ